MIDRLQAARHLPSLPRFPSMRRLNELRRNISVTMHKVFIVMSYTIPALAIFIWSGNVDWALGLCLAAGNAVGGWWAAKFSVKGGEKYIRYVLVVAIFIIALKLLGLF